MQNKRSAIIVSVVVLIIVAVVIGLFVSKARDKSTNNKTNTTSSSSTTSMSNMENNSSGKAVNTSSVAIKDFAFSPATITVKVGTTVTWTNQDSAAHTVTSDSGSKDSFDSGSMAQGKTFSHTFKTAGTFNYICTFHPDMMGKVEVTE